VILHNSRVSRHAVVANTIMDKNVIVQEGATVGVDEEHDPGPRPGSVQRRYHRGRQGTGDATMTGRHIAREAW
jgi:hypothetical protein